MFEGWAADVLASYLGKYLDLPRDRLRISLWGGALLLRAHTWAMSLYQR
jgi:hypothetical protein